MHLNANSCSSLTLVGPFTTQLVVNSQELIYIGYPEFQRNLLMKLSLGPGNGLWHIGSGESRVSKLSFDVDTYQGKPITPRYLIEFDYAPYEALQQEIDQLAAGISLEINVRLTAINLKYMDSGTGSICFSTECSFSASQSAPQLKQFHERFSSLLSEMASKLIMECTAILKDAIPVSYLIMEDQTRNKLPALAWIHRVAAVDTHSCPGSSYDEIAMAFIAKMDDNGLRDASIIEGLHFYPSIGNSLVVYNGPNLDDNIHFRALERMVEFINCKWLSMSEMDTYLFYQINDLSRNTHQLKLKDLEIRYNLIQEICEQIILFNSILFNHKINLSPQEHRIWECVSETWKLPELISAVATKSDTLKSMNQGILERLQNKQNNKLNYLVFVFTTISFVTIVLQVIDFVQQGVNVPNILRSLTMIFLTVMVAFSVRRLRNWLFG